MALLDREPCRQSPVVSWAEPNLRWEKNKVGCHAYSRMCSNATYVTCNVKWVSNRLAQLRLRPVLTLYWPQGVIATVVTSWLQKKNIGVENEEGGGAISPPPLPNIFQTSVYLQTRQVPCIQAKRPGRWCKQQSNLNLNHRDIVPRSLCTGTGTTVIRDILWAWLNFLHAQLY